MGCSIIVSGIRFKDGYHQKSPYNSLTNAAGELSVVLPRYSSGAS